MTSPQPAGQPGDESAGPLLTPSGELVSDLWLDQPDAHHRVETRQAAGEIAAHQAEALLRFLDRGYLTFTLDLDPRVVADVEASVERLWQERPPTVACAYHSQLRPFDQVEPRKARRPSYRIADLHSFSQGALELYLDRQIFDWVELIFGQKAVATQSLYFEYGSQQRLHRDPVFVHHTPPSHLLAAWVALEDIHPDSGPLLHVAGSHRLPYYQFEPGEFRFDPARQGYAEEQAMEEFLEVTCRERGLEAVPFTPRLGEALIWHASLIHGGSRPRDPDRTRKSFVVHYATFGNHECLTQLVEEEVPDDGGALVTRRQSYTTRQLLSRDRCYGFDNPLHHRRLRGG